MALSSNKARSGLTILGIVIGISSVIVMVAIGQGAQGSVKSKIQSMGSNLIMIMPGATKTSGVRSAWGSAKTLTQEDVEAIESEISNIKAVAPEVSGRYQITSKGENANASVVGTNPAYQEVKNIEIDQGEFISTQHLGSKSKVAVIGPTIAEDLFATGTDPLGQAIRINSIEFRVIGVTKSKGGSISTSADNTIFIPLTTAQRFLVGNTYITTINISAENEELMTVTQEDITNLLLARHNITDASSADFRVMNQSDMLETASSVTGTLTNLLAAVAAISLVVGGIGIMNMMLTTVTERTREIGLRKAIGARRADISKQFLVESITLTFLGGFLGIMIGWVVSFLFTYFNVITAQVSVGSIFLAFGVSALIGVIFGYYPARRAANFNPIEALRYE
jgi:putative ABC transport system permease protein